ncbi:MAG TPA: glycosyl hydrolase, partial [Bryobacteraceae bacterium]|nr:glycosyl hydrolase [Bryobacteraceae bacterium]
HGTYYWTTLDRAVETILATGATPLMSLEIKPRPLYPEIDQDKTDPTSYEEWEQLVERLVRHYRAEKQYDIHYWEVFNEPDIGEDGGSPGRFTPESYARYYEHTVRAIRRADPAAKVGGPALANSRSPLLKGLLDHCSRNNVPLDFVSWHIYHSDPAAIQATITHVNNLLKDYPSLRCETILDEWNMSLSHPRTEPAYQPAFLIETIARMRESGLDYAAYYHIRDFHVEEQQFAPFMSRKGLLNMLSWWNLTPQYDGLFDFQGVMRPAYFAFKMLSRLSGNRVEARSDRPEVKVLAAWDNDQSTLNLLVWNFAVTSPAPVRVTWTPPAAEGEKWTYRRLLLDADTASNDENHRMRPAEGIEAFDLAPYGVTLISAHKRE